MAQMKLCFPNGLALRVPPAVTRLTVYRWLHITWIRDCGSSASFTSGNQVDGLPLAPSTGAVHLGAEAQKYICMTARPLIMKFSRSYHQIAAPLGAHLGMGVF